MANQARLRLFEETFSGDLSQSFERLKTKAYTGTLKGSGLRSLCWKFFLGSIPSPDPSREKWIEAMQTDRAEYTRLRDEILINPYKEQQENKDLVTNNPLAETKDSVWSKYFELQELQKEIMTDVERLAMEEEVLKDEGTHEAMLRILTIWASLHPTVAYRQGMHEVLAPIYFILHQDALDLSDGSSPVMSLWDKQFLEHDAYALFSMLMIHLTDSFAPPQRPAKGAGPPKPSGVVQRCERLQNELLRDKDYQLYIHLQSCQVQPQLYAMKWIRLLLGREFHLDDVLLLWDAIFAEYHAAGQKTEAEGGGLALLDWIMVAMVRYVRQQLLDSDNMGCLRRLMKYPPVEDVRVFVVQALELRSSKGAAPQIPAVPPPQRGGPIGTPLLGSSPPSSSSAIPINGTSGSTAPTFPKGTPPKQAQARPSSQASAPQPPPPSTNPNPFAPPAHQDSMPASPYGGAAGREDSGDMQPGGLEGLCGGPILSALSVLESLLPPPSDPRHERAAAAIAQIHSFHSHVTGLVQGDQGPRRPGLLDPQAPPNQGMVGIGAWRGQGGTDSPSPAASPGGVAAGGGGRSGGGWAGGGEEGREGSGGWEKVVVVEREESAAERAAGAKREEERRTKREEEAAAAAAKKKVAEEVAQKRKVALGMLLEPTSPGAVPAEEGGKEDKDKEFGNKELFGKPKLSKSNSTASSNKDLFGDDDDVSSWLNPKSS